MDILQVRPRFGAITIGLILADLFNGMGSLAGIDLAISAYGEHRAQQWEVKFRSLPLEERYALVDEYRKKTGFMKHWTGETVPLLIGHLPEKTKEQRELKQRLGKRAVEWYLHLNTPFNHYLALKVADELSHFPEFRQFMHNFVQEKVLPLPEEDETNTLVRFFFLKRRQFNGNPLAHYTMGFPYVVDKLASQFDRVTMAMMDAFRRERELILDVFDEIHGETGAALPASETPPAEMPAADDPQPIHDDLKYIQPRQALSSDQVALLEEHMEELGPPLNPIQPVFKQLYSQWLLDHPLKQQADRKVHKEKDARRKTNVLASK